MTTSDRSSAQYWDGEPANAYIRDAEPLGSISELRIEGVDDDEIDELLKVIRSEGPAPT